MSEAAEAYELRPQPRGQATEVAAMTPGRMAAGDRTVTVTIGRNYAEDDQPMSLLEWRRFQRELRQWAGGAMRDIYFMGEGSGWSTQWGSEDSYTIVGEWMGWKCWPDFAEELAALARDFGQEAVAVTWGQTYFVS